MSCPFWAITHGGMHNPVGISRAGRRVVASIPRNALTKIDRGAVQAALAADEPVT